ncbi:hypothetical protein [Celeribacter persicus]|jgi:hypothetical protein|uniref:Uncharacterized protein n=1 Tax=Celeribacter persicus TaxID=1651082 RepID=A0A2T5HK80_9RHOB|nr:hypothetical protein [Celeribacter persicus]PTQ71985.1 hypothetical protein C8N42_107164 [Celeribacter persicus]
MFVFTKFNPDMCPTGVLSKAALIAAFALGVMVAGAPVSASQTETGAQKTTVGGRGDTRFDWLARGKDVADASSTVSATAPQGSGSWICSPAGFGNHSRCYRR